MTPARSPEEIEARRSEAVRLAEAFIPGTRDNDGLITVWWLSFTDPTFLGGMFIEAPTMLAAVARSHMLGINPGGEVLAMGFRAEAVEPGWVNRLLTKAEAEDAPVFPGAVPLDL